MERLTHDSRHVCWIVGGRYYGAAVDMEIAMAWGAIYFGTYLEAHTLAMLFMTLSLIRKPCELYLRMPTPY
jgi:hypothetical protein